jgi:hypothetical protein
MTEHEPIEPSAILAPDGTVIPYRSGLSGAVPAAPRNAVSEFVQAASTGPLLAATAFAVTAVAAAKAAEMAGRMAWHVAQGAFDGGRPGRPPGGGVEVTWTHVEIRWPF